jgi:Sigma-70, region 4
MDDDLLCQQFFREPDQLLHRRYEVLRAFFVERRPLTEIAQQFDLSYGTVRNLISDFRTQCRDGCVAPFFAILYTDDPRLRLLRHPLAPILRTSPTVDS